ncbi:MAG TPA: hypothetical protein ENJ01_02410 [Gammaproteobacteria bacterium]|nr:hypothetical protein [Gammaproteobacteria bacterium]
MNLNVVVGEDSFPVNVPEDVLTEAVALFDKMDRDMDKGWQMGRFWVEAPTVEQRCQIVADKLLTALSNDNPNLATMMAAYILARMPNTTAVFVATNGEIIETEFERG